MNFGVKSRKSTQGARKCYYSGLQNCNALRYSDLQSRNALSALLQNLQSILTTAKFCRSDWGFSKNLLCFLYLEIGLELFRSS